MTSRVRYGQFLIQTAPLSPPSGPRPPKNMGHQYPLISSIGADAPCSKTPSRPDRNPVHISLTPVSLRCAPIFFRHMLLESPRAEFDSDLDTAAPERPIDESGSRQDWKCTIRAHRVTTTRRFRTSVLAADVGR